MKTILVVDDHTVIRGLINHCLIEDYSLIETSTGVTGLRVARRMLPDLILLDISMPGKLDGLDVLDLLKADIETAYIPVIIITAHEHLLASTCLRRGAANYLIKPFGKVELCKAIDDALNTECEKQN